MGKYIIVESVNVVWNYAPNLGSDKENNSM